MLLINVFILFIFKKNEKLRLYMNYRELNFVIIKNRYLLLLIIKTLNRLNDLKYFNKLNLKNIYYRIYIKRDDK